LEETLKEEVESISETEERLEQEKTVWLEVIPFRVGRGYAVA
jgi:hypothetical protein